MRATLLAGLAAIAALSLGCGAQQHPNAPAMVQVVAEPDNARVLVDDRDVGSARVLANRPHRVSIGSHQISIEADGYFPHDLEIDFPRGITTVRVRLRPIPE